MRRVSNFEQSVKTFSTAFFCLPEINQRELNILSDVWSDRKKKKNPVVFLRVPLSAI